MNFKNIFTIMFICLLASCNTGNKNNEHDSSHSESEEVHGHESHNHEAGNGTKEHSDEITFHKEKAEKFGVKSSIIKPQPFNEIIKVSGEISSAQGDQITIVAPSSGVVNINRNISLGSPVNKGSRICSISSRDIVGGDSNENARINYLGAKRELDRITPLYENKIVTEKEYNIAKQEYERAKIAYSPAAGSGTVANSPISGTVTSLFIKDGEYVEAGTPVAVVSKNARLTLKANLPERYFGKLHTIYSANFKPSFTDEVMTLKEMNGKMISSRSVNNSVNGYIPVIFEFDNKSNILPGTYCEVYLLGTLKDNALAVPVESLIEEQGNYYIFIKLDDDCYEKRNVTPGASDGNSIEIISGLKPGENVVTEKAILIKLAANTGEIPHGHTH